MTVNIDSASASTDGFEVTLEWEVTWASRGGGGEELFISVGHKTTRPSYAFSYPGDTKSDSWTVTFDESEAGAHKGWKVSSDNDEVGGTIELPEDSNGNGGNGGTEEPSITNLDVTINGTQMQASAEIDNPNNQVGLNDFLWGLGQTDGDFSDSYRNGPGWTVSDLPPGNYEVNLDLVGGYDSASANFEIKEQDQNGGVTSIDLFDLSVQAEEDEIAATVGLEEEGGEIPGGNVEWTLIKGGNVVEEKTSEGQFLRTTMGFNNHGPGEYTLEVYAYSDQAEDSISVDFDVQGDRSASIQSVETDGLSVMPLVGVSPDDAAVSNVYWDLINQDSVVASADGAEPTLEAPQEGTFTLEARVEFSDGVIKSDQTEVTVQLQDDNGGNGENGNGDQGDGGRRALLAGAAIAGAGGLALVANSDEDNS